MVFIFEQQSWEFASSYYASKINDVVNILENIYIYKTTDIVAHVLDSEWIKFQDGRASTQILFLDQLKCLLVQIEERKLVNTNRLPIHQFTIRLSYVCGKNVSISPPVNSLYI